MFLITAIEARIFGRRDKLSKPGTAWIWHLAREMPFYHHLGINLRKLEPGRSEIQLSPEEPDSGFRYSTWRRSCSVSGFGGGLSLVHFTQASGTNHDCRTQGELHRSSKNPRPAKGDGKYPSQGKANRSWGGRG